MIYSDNNLHSCLLSWLNKKKHRVEQIGCVSLYKMNIGMSDDRMNSKNIDKNGQIHY